MVNLKIPSKPKLIEAIGRGRMHGPIWPLVLGMFESLRKIEKTLAGAALSEWFFIERVMPAFNELIGGHGVEKLVLIVNRKVWTIFYVNMGDSYSTTVLCWIRRDSLRLNVKLEIGCWGDLAEKYPEPEEGDKL